MLLKADPSRRTLLGGLIAAAASSTSAKARAARSIVQRPTARVMVDNDFAGDPDGLVALAHQLLNAGTRVTLITSSALDPKLSAGLPVGRTAAAGIDAAVQLMDVMELDHRPSTFAGAETFGAVASSAAAAIVAEAMREDTLPLFLTCGGPLTNVAAALRSKPEIGRRLTLIWIGASADSDREREYNLLTNVAAARYVYEHSSVPIWQVTKDTYRRVQYSVAEMNADFQPISPLTEWLYQIYTALPEWVDLGGSLTFGDSPLVLLPGLSVESSRSCDIVARRLLPDGTYGADLPGRRIRVFDKLDRRLLLADMLSTFRLHAVR